MIISLFFGVNGSVSSRADYGVRKGNIYINDKIGDLGSYKKLIGFVPQEDVKIIFFFI
jgi:hypothetical protein